MKKFICCLIVVLITVFCGRRELPETASFIELSTCPLPGYAKDIDIAGDLAYVADDQGGLQIVNIDNPESTFVVGQYVIQRDIAGVAVRDTFAYLAVAYSQGGMITLNVADPSNPTFVGSDQSFYGYDLVAPADDTMFVYIAASYWFYVEDVASFPQYPSHVRGFTTTGDVRGIYMVDSLVFLACEQMGMHIFNLARPDSEAYVGWIDTPSNARKLFVEGNYAYVADGRAGLVIIDISDLNQLSIVGQYDTPAYANEVYIYNNCAYVADGEGGLQVIDVSSPEEPTYYGSFETPYAYGVYVKDTLIFVADRDQGLIIVTQEEE